MEQFFHYGNEIFDEMNGDTVHAPPIISENEQKAETNAFLVEFNEVFNYLKQNISEEGRRKFRANLLKREDMAEYIESILIDQSQKMFMPL